MFEQKLLKKRIIQNGGYQFTFIFESFQNILLVCAKNIATLEKVQNKFSYEALPNVLQVLFQNNEELFAYLSVLSKQKIAYTSKQNGCFITVSFSLLNKQKIVDLPVQHVQDNDAKIKEYQNKIESICLENRRLTVQLRTAEDKIQSLTRQLRYAKDKIQNLEDDIQILEIKAKKRPFSEGEGSAPMIVPNKASYKLALDSTEYEITSKIHEEELYKFQTESPIHNYFHLQSGKIFVHQQFKDFHQVVSAEPLSLKQRSVVRIRINKSSKNNIYFGIMRESRKKEKFTCQHQHSITYKLCGGKFLFEDGKQSGEQMNKVRIGEVLCLIVDPLQNCMTWFIDKVFMTKRSLPNNFQQVPLFPFVSLHDVGDEVEFL